MSMKTYIFFQDPANGWLRVPKSDIPSGMKLSQASYQQGSYVYLDENDDMHKFRELIPCQIKVHYDYDTNVRNFQRIR